MGHTNKQNEPKDYMVACDMNWLYYLCQGQHQIYARGTKPGMTSREALAKILHVHNTSTLPLRDMIRPPRAGTEYHDEPNLSLLPLPPASK